MSTRVADRMIITRCSRFFIFCLVFSLAACCVAAQEGSLRVGIKPVEPFVIKVKNDGYTGISIDLWEEIARINNIDFKYVELTNTEQLIQACEKGDVDLAIAAITMTYDRLKRVDFSNTMFNQVSAWRYAVNGRE